MINIKTRITAWLAAACLGAAGAAVATTGHAHAAEPPKVAVLGDSFSGWAANPNPIPAGGYWFNYTARDLGWRVGNVIANPGAGYVKAGDYGTALDALRAHPIDPDTDYALVMLGLNDSSVDPAAVSPAVAAVLAELRRQAPGVTPIVVGALLPFNHLLSDRHVQVARAIGDWQAIGSTRYTIGFMATFETGPDGVHPSPNGHHQLGDWVAWHIANGLDNGTPLHAGADGVYR